MPTKRNKAGNQQNYVPAGHGDASGEYGDNSTGSNKHIQFTSFKKPKETRSKELDKKQINEIANYVISRKGLLNDDSNYYKRLISNLRYYEGSFGDLSKFSDEDLKDIIEEFSNLEVSDEFVHFKKGSKWMMTKNVGLLDKLGIEHFTKEQKEEQLRKDNMVLIEKSQTNQDKEIQKTLGGKSTVCFGKGYSKDVLGQIEKDTQTYVNDFPELKDKIKVMGDRNNLEKYLTAINQTKEFSEEEISDMMNKLKKFGFMYDDGKLREKAIEKLRTPVKFQSMRNAYAYWSNDRGAMVYMGKMKKVDEEERQHNFDINWSSSNKLNHTFCHELGHAVDYAIKDQYEKIGNEFKSSNWNKYSEISTKYSKFRQKIEELSNRNYNQEYKTKFEQKYKELSGKDYNTNSYNYEKLQMENKVKEELKNEGVRKYNLSEYGTTNTKEFVAECFGAYYTGMNNPLANEVVEEYKKISKELRDLKL